MGFKTNSLLWGKLADGMGEVMHPLLLHCLDVGAVAAGIWHEILPLPQRQWLARCFGVSTQAFSQWLGFWGSVHDLGKATPGFQSKARRIAPALCVRLRQAGLRMDDLVQSKDHGLLGRAVLEQMKLAQG